MKQRAVAMCTWLICDCLTQTFIVYSFTEAQMYSAELLGFLVSFVFLTVFVASSLSFLVLLQLGWRISITEELAGSVVLIGQQRQHSSGSDMRMHCWTAAREHSQHFDDITAPSLTAAACVCCWDTLSHWRERHQEERRAWEEGLLRANREWESARGRGSGQR